MLCKSLNDVLTPLIHRRETAEKDTHDTSVSFLAVRSHLSHGQLRFVFQQVLSWMKKKKRFLEHPQVHTCSINMQIFPFLWFKLVQYCRLCDRLQNCFSCFRDWVNELRMSPTLPLGPQVIIWSNATFVFELSVCYFHKQWDITVVIWSLLGGVSPLPFINGWGHFHYIGSSAPCHELQVQTATNYRNPAVK